MAKRAAPNNETPTSQNKSPKFHPDYQMLATRFEFLEATYDGGVAYKEARDQYGLPVLVAHENELGAQDGQLVMAAQAMIRGQWGKDVLTKYGRRRRAAVFENHFKPIVDKVAGYTLRAIPSRQVDENRVRELELDANIKDMTLNGLTVDMYWIGIDANAVPSDENGDPIEVVSKADEEAVGLSDPYIRLIHPKYIVDWEEDDDGELTRVVIHEPETTKASFTEDQKTVDYYTEWTLTGWERFELKEEKGTGKTLVRVAGAPNEFRRKDANGKDVPFVPFHKFNPRFPSEDLAEMNRSLFNMMSLLDEELFGNTFTQKVVTGSNPENVEKTGSGVGNVMVLPDPDSKIYVVGAIPDQAKMLMERVQQLREGMYQLANLDATGQKNVAETDDKKRRDLETLYTMLVGIIEDVEYAENWVLWSLNLIDSIDDQKATNYPRKFDVSSVTDILEELNSLMQLPYAPPGLKRRKMKELVKYLSPLEDNQELEDEIDSLPDISETALSAIERLHLLDRLTPELIVRILGMPEDLQKAIADQDAAAKEHAIEAEVQNRMNQRDAITAAADQQDQQVSSDNANADNNQF